MHEDVVIAFHALHLTRTRPARAAAHCVNSHSYEFGPHMPILSPRSSPSDRKPAATWSACVVAQVYICVVNERFEYRTSSRSCLKVLRMFWCTLTTAVASPYFSAPF